VSKVNGSIINWLLYNFYLFILIPQAMSFQDLMLTYGYPILFVGVILESEAFLLVGAYLAHKGYFSLPAVIAVAALSSFVITQIHFFVGHRYGAQFLAKRPKWQQRFSRVQYWLHRYGVGLLLGFRVLYGLRGVIPAAIGLSRFPKLQFLALNAIGALLWALVVALAGNSIVEVAERLFINLRKHEWIVVSLITGLAVLWSLYLFHRQSKLKQTMTQNTKITYGELANDNNANE
jgi:membrane protein DedA with SNARE-associated domain